MPAVIDIVTPLTQQSYAVLGYPLDPTTSSGFDPQVPLLLRVGPTTPIIDPRDHGAIPDTILFDLAVSSGSPIVTSPSGGFAAAQVGDTIWIHGYNIAYQVGLNAHHLFESVITSKTSSTQVTVDIVTAGPPYITATGLYGGVGRDQTAAFTKAVAAAVALGTSAIAVPGSYCASMTLPFGLSVLGRGRGSARLRARPGLDGPVIQMEPGNTGSPPSRIGALLTVRDLTIDGNSGWQSAGATTAHCLTNNAGAPFSANAADVEFDTLYQFENLYLVNAKNDGYRGLGRSAGKLHNVDAYYNNGNSFNPAPDTELVQCVSGSSGLEGFAITNPAVRLSACKTFYSGRITQSRGHGVLVQYVTGGTTAISALEAQDNRAHGLAIINSRFVNVQMTADSNSTSSAGAYAALLLDGAQDCTINLTGMDRNSGAGATQRSAIKAINGATNNAVQLAWGYTDSGATRGPIIDSGSTAILGNAITVGAQRGGLQAVPWAATITPDPYKGETLTITLTGNVSFATPANAHPGVRLTVILTQDATGGRTVTFNASYKVSWTPVTTATAVNTITLVYTGTQWVQVSAQVGL